jgi:DNA-binding NarL/FixJ family response regulator
MYHHGLFAQGVRSVLETQSGVQIVGMEKSTTKALKAVAALKPEVIVVEQPTSGKKKRERLESFLQSVAAGRVVFLSLAHNRATVYQRQQLATVGPADLVKAILGSGKRHIPRPDQPQSKASLRFQPESGSNADHGRSGQQTRVRRTRRQGTRVSDTLPRTSRGSQKGG